MEREESCKIVVRPRKRVYGWNMAKDMDSRAVVVDDCMGNL